MEKKLAQIKLRTANYDYNYNRVVEVASKSDSDLIVFPQIALCDLGAKDMVFDDVCQRKQYEMFEKLAENNFKAALLFGDIMVNNGEILQADDGFFELNGEKIYVSDEYSDEIECDLYVLAKNSYFTVGEKLADSIEVNSDFIYVNAVALSDENVFAGGSFAKNSKNEIIAECPLCEECVLDLDFSKVIDVKDCENEEKIYKVLTFALSEYCANTGFKKVVLGLSGGIDSALTAALAVGALGKKNVLGILLPSMFSSEGSVVDALALADNLGIKTEKHSITPLFDKFMETFDRKHDLAEENLQARIRAMILMFVSNREGHLLLSTGNKSEGAMGYGTLYGDLAGGLNLICDLTKMNVYKLSNWINRNGIVIPKEIIEKAPSAELRPNQKDQDSLPEYAVLDEIIEMYVEQNMPMEEIYKKFDKKLVDETVKKIYRAEFKRRQCCLGIRVTERAFASNVSYPVSQGMY